MNSPQFYLAPLQGYTDIYYRYAHHHSIGGADKYFTPFFNIGKKGIEPRLEPELSTQLNDSMYYVPQLLVADAQELNELMAPMMERGYQEINFNMGCPHAPLTRKSYGSGLLKHPEKIKEILTEAFEKYPQVKFSVKMRLGWENTTDSYAALEVINQFPVHEIIVHPRLGVQQYKGSPHWEAFDYFVQNVKAPLIANGDITSVDELKKIQTQFPTIERFMIGRGVLLNPFLLQEFRGEEFTEEQKREKLLLLVNKMQEAITLANIDLNKTRTTWMSLWFYWIKILKDGKKCFKSIQHSSDVNFMFNISQGVIRSSKFKVAIDVDELLYGIDL